MKVATEHITETIAEMLASSDHVGKAKVRPRVRLALFRRWMQQITVYFSI